jgi:hypothetical protein
MPLYRQKIGMGASGGPRWWDTSESPAFQFESEPEVIV